MLFWDESSETEVDVPDDVVDVSYRVDCRCLSLDHAYALSGAILGVLPWLADESLAGIHLIHGAESGNGWYRPEDPANDVLHLSRRARFRLRVPRHRIRDAEALSGRRVEVGGFDLGLGSSNVLPLQPLPALMARYVIADAGQDEPGFLSEVARQLEQQDISAPKLLCGRSHWLHTPGGDVFTRSLMVADLDPHASVQLQRVGMGAGRLLGCGLFIGHKDISPVQPKGE